MRVSLVVFFIFIYLFSCYKSSIIIPSSNVPSAPYPDWAHKHWVWLASSQANQTKEEDLVDGYLERNVPVGAVNLDSEWSTGINNFVFDTTKYPNPQSMINYFHSKDVKVICWATSLVDTDSPNYQEGYNNDYYLNNGRTIKWWHGHGSFIDYTNPDAVEWWHNQMDNVLDMGLDGWKCDGTDPYTFEFIDIKGQGGHITERDYANMYYGDFFNYTRTKNPESLIMSRPVDSYAVLYWSFSPHYVMYSGWVGDQDPTFDGLKDALRNYFHSAWRGYANYGSDIGGYRTGDGTLGRTKELFIRWAQLGSMSPLMENGGNKEHRPWMFDNNNQTLDIYRNFVHIHYELIPYFLNAGSTAMEKGISVMTPKAKQTILHPDSWDYMLWDDLFIAPIVKNSTTRKIGFPEGNNWVSWFNTSQIYDGGSTIHYDVPLEIFPIFIRQGALLALNITNSYGSRFGNKYHDGYYTLFIASPKGSNNQTIRKFRGQSQEFQYTHTEDQEESSYSLEFSATSHQSNKLLIHIRDIDSPYLIHNEVLNKELPITSSLNKFYSHSHDEPCYFYDKEKRYLWIKPGNTENGLSLHVLGETSVFNETNF